MQFAARLGAWYLRPVILRAAGYERAARRIERGRKYVAGALAASAASVGLAGSSLSRSSRRRPVTSNRQYKTAPMDTPRYGPGSALPGGSASGFQTRKRYRDDEYNVTVVDGSGYRQLTRLPKQIVGAPLARQEVINRHTEANMQARIDRFQWLGKSSASQGPYWLSYCPNDATTLTQYYLPLYTFDLTSLGTNTGVDGNGAVTYWNGIPFLRLRRDATNPNAYNWQTQYGLTNDGITPTRTWTYESLPYLAAQENTPYDKAFLRWADIRLQLWGATGNPSSVEVMLVRFTDEHVAPPSYESVDGGANVLITHPVPETPATVSSSTSGDFAQYQKFWTSHLDNLVSNPNMMRLKFTDSKGMSVIYRKKIDLNPTASYETDTSGHQYTLCINYLMDMIGNYNHFNSSSVRGDGQVADLSNPNQWPQEVTIKENHSVLCNRNSRVFLVIKGLASKSTEPSLVGAGNTVDNASFDLMVRRCVTLL